MNPNNDTQNQQPKTLSERVPPPVMAAIVTGVFALIVALAGSYFPNRVRMDELRIGATQTVEIRALQATQAAAGIITPTPGNTEAPATATASTKISTEPTSTQGVPVDMAATPPPEATVALPPQEPPTATPAVAPTNTAAPAPTSTPSPQPANTAAPATPTVAPTHTPLPPPATLTVAPTTTAVAPPATVTPAPTDTPGVTPTLSATATATSTPPN